MRDICNVTKQSYDNGWDERNGGNISIRITEDGKHADLYWGYEDGAKPTSEFPTHLMSHIARLKTDKNQRVVMHCHPTNFIAMSFTQTLDEKRLSRILWKMQAESLVVFPEGIGI